MNSDSLWWLVSLLIAPGLMGLAFAMEWMEEHLAHQLAAHDVTTAWRSIVTPEDLEIAIAHSTARLAPSRGPR